MWILIGLIALWLVLAIVGLVVSGLKWLLWVAIILTAVTVVVGFVTGLFSRK